MVCIEFEPDIHIRDRQHARRFFGPFHETDRGLVEVLVKPCFKPFLWSVESIKIKVIQNIPRNHINFNQCVGRALDRAFAAQRAQQSAGERSLAGAEVAMQVDFQAGYQRRRQCSAQRKSGGLAGKREGKMLQ